MEQSLQNHRDLVLGIDPGLTGAYAFFRPLSKELLITENMPNLLDKNQNKTINTIQLSNALRLFSHRTRFAVVEKVSARPGNAAQSTFKLGQALGIVEGILGCLQIPVLYAVPSVWKLMMKLSANKKDSLKLAREMFPESHTWLAREKDHDRAESILLAVYGAYFLKK